MKRRTLSIGELLTIQFSLGYLLIYFLIVNQSPSPGHGRGDERVKPATPTQQIRHTQYFHLLKSPEGGGGVRCTTQV